MDTPDQDGAKRPDYGAGHRDPWTGIRYRPEVGAGAGTQRVLDPSTALVVKCSRGSTVYVGPG